MRDTILSLGCSYTDTNFKARGRLLKDVPASVTGGWPMWPQIFTERLSERDQVQYKLVNAGKAGTSMDFATEKFFENWLKYKDRLKVVLWGGTSYFRLEHFANGKKMAVNHFQDGRQYDSVGINPNYEKVDATIRELGCSDYLKNLAMRTKDKEMYLRQAKVNHERIVAIRDLCESNDVHFIFYPLIAPFTGGTYSEFGGRTRPLTRGEELNYISRIQLD